MVKGLNGIFKKKAGLPPGSLVYTGKERKEKVTMELMDFDSSKYAEVKVRKISECIPFKDAPTVSWLNINGVHDTSVLEEVGKVFDIHPLVLEDIVNVHQRPKVDFFKEYLYIVLGMLHQDPKTKMVSLEQVSIILGKGFVISFQEIRGDVFDPVRDRIRKAKGRIRTEGPDFLAYALLDAIVDNYFVVLENISASLDDLEARVFKEADEEALRAIQRKKRDLVTMKRSIWPLREVVNSLLREESPLIRDGTDIYLKDLYDHTIHVIENVEGMKDTVSGLADLYMTQVSNRMNEIMKVLTIIATIFIPLTFIAGIYGMNFDTSDKYNMPELGWKYGYIAIWGVMLLLAFIMFIYFKRKKWL